MRRWLGKVVSGLGFYGTLAGLGLLPLPATAIALTIGAVSGNLTAAFALALAMSLAANVVMVIYLLRRRSRHPHRGEARPPRPKAYAVPGQWDTILLTSADFEAWWANLLSVLRERVGSDVRAYVEAIHLGDNPFIVFRGSSAAALKRCSGTVGGPLPAHVFFYGINRVDSVPDRELAPPLWRSDDSWKDLLTRVWIRERHGDGSAPSVTCVLYARQRNGGRLWYMSLGPYHTDDDRLVPGRGYWLHDGELQSQTN